MPPEPTDEPDALRVDTNLGEQGGAEMETKTSDVKVLEPRGENGWITAVCDGHWFQAKIYDEPSTYGVGGWGRVSKLAILKAAEHDRDSPFFDQCCYNYDRGLDFDEAPAGLVDRIVAWCEALPTIGPVYA